MNLVMNLIFGILFEISFITLMIIRIKDIKEKKIRLFLSVTATYFLSGILINFTYNNQYIFYILFNVICFLFLKLLYKRKTNLVDLFFIYYVEMILNFSCLILMVILGYNTLFAITNRILLIIIVLLSKNINKLYKLYSNNWNRKTNNKIKSITLRNVTIISSNIMLYIINSFIMNYFMFIIS